MWGYWRAHNLEPGTNLIAHHFKLIGLPEWIPEEQEVVSLSSASSLVFNHSSRLRPAAKLTLMMSPSNAKNVKEQSASNVIAPLT